MIMEKEEEDDELFVEWPAEEEQQEITDNEDEEKETEVERISRSDLPRQCVSLANRRASLPCTTQLNAMHLTHLTHLRISTMVPSPIIRHRFQDDDPPAQHNQNQHREEKNKCVIQPSATLNLRHAPETRGRFRGRNVLSLSDADTMCLICHDDLHRTGGTVQELHCFHSFHSKCIEGWLWMKLTCPICHKHMAVPEPLYWTSTRVKVP